MSDERLRELERRWHETGSLPDREAWEWELVRAGYPSRQECYAYLMHALLMSQAKYFNNAMGIVLEAASTVSEGMTHMFDAIAYALETVMKKGNNDE